MTDDKENILYSTEQCLCEDGQSNTFIMRNNMNTFMDIM